jgi:cytochrome c-type biogenesis protein CcmH/NrfG
MAYSKQLFARLHLRRAPANATAWYLCSVIAMAARDYRRAVAELERAVQRLPSRRASGKRRRSAQAFAFVEQSGMVLAR